MNQLMAIISIRCPLPSLVHQACIHDHIHTYTCAHTLIYMCTCAPTHALTHTHACMHTHTQLHDHGLSNKGGLLIFKYMNEHMHTFFSLSLSLSHTHKAQLPWSFKHRLSIASEVDLWEGFTQHATLQFDVCALH